MNREFWFGLPKDRLRLNQQVVGSMIAGMGFGFTLGAMYAEYFPTTLRVAAGMIPMIVGPIGGAIARADQRRQEAQGN